MKRIITFICLSLFVETPFLFGQSFSVQLKDGNKLYFHVTDTLNKTVEIANVNTLIEVLSPLPVGNLDIPSSVKYKDISYQVTSIGDKVFSGASELKLVSIPSSVSNIGSFAFENCTALESIIFPSREPKVGKGAFAGCTTIKKVSIGSDWQNVDCGIFSSSSTLEALWIPARVIRILNLKKLIPLKEIVVDANNPKFLSKDNLLYNKNGKTLLACPVSKEGVVVVHDGTEMILDGAFNGCEKLTEISLPSSIHDFSYMSFAQCLNLSKIVMCSEVPPTTARWNGSSVFAVRLPNPNVFLEVPSGLLAHYQISVCDKAGEYESVEGKDKQILTEEGWLNKESIKIAKNKR